MNEFNLDAFSSNLDEAIKYIKVNKSVNINKKVNFSCYVRKGT